MEWYDYLRPADLCTVTVGLEGVRIDDDGTALVRNQSATSIVVRLPPQHFAEPALAFEYDDETTRASFEQSGFEPSECQLAVPLLARTGAKVVYRLPEGTDRVDIPDGPDGLLLALRGCEFVSGQTALDLLARALFTIPHLDWQPIPDPMSLTSPVWSVRPLPGASRSVRHVPDLFEDGPLKPELLRAPDLKILSRAFDMVFPDGSREVYGPVFPYRDRAFEARKLHLTSLGGTVSLVGPTDGADAGSYEHRTSLGRDVYVERTVHGTLSTGHRAMVNIISKRVLRGSHGMRDPVIGTMLATAELVFTEPELDLRNRVGEFHDEGRSMPFRRLTIGHERAMIDIPPDPEPGGLPTTPVFHITWRGKKLLFDLLGTDVDGREVAMRLPLAFLPDGQPAKELVDLVGNNGVIATLAATPVTLAPDAPPGASAITVTQLQLAVVVGRAARPLPTIASLKVAVDALAGLGGSVPVVSAVFDPVFLQQGLTGAGNPARAFLSFTEHVELKLPTAALGGVGNPGGVLTRVSSVDGAIPAVRSGPVPSLEQLRKSFPAPRLFGRIDLLDYLGTFTSVPKLLRTGPPGAETLTYEFSAELKHIPAPAHGSMSTTANSRLLLRSTVDLSPSRPAARSYGEVTNISFALAGAVRISFERVVFTTDAGGKTSFDLKGVDVRFLGAFEYLAAIADKLSSLGSGSGVRTDVDAKGVTAGFELAVPTIAMGVAQLSNLSMAAFLRIPFTDAPLSFSLDIASRERPFLATVSMFGGGGFLSMTLTPDGLRTLEAGIEFGGSMSLDIVVASGGVSVMAGIYFNLDEHGGFVASAYVRASGHLSVLGIVSLFVEFVMGLTYAKVGHTATFKGRASVTVGIKVLFFSKSVTLTVERSFAGSNADPTFLETFDGDDWSEYGLAFAGRDGPSAIPPPFGGGGVA